MYSKPSFSHLETTRMYSMENNKNWIIAKFGGTSVHSKNNWIRIRAIIKSYQQQDFRPLLVCSAISGVSDLLDELTKKAPQNNYKTLLQQIKNKHLDLCNDLDVDCEEYINSQLIKLEKLCLGISLLEKCTLDIYARIMAFGELFLTNIAKKWLEKNNLSTTLLDARDCLKTKSNYISESEYIENYCELEEDISLQKKLSAINSDIFITQGFIASNSQNETVLLGRGGSDTSASYFAVKLKAKQVEIWTDVPGVFTSNPEQIPEAKLLRQLDYDEAQELATSGAKVLHPRCLFPLKSFNIPCKIRWIKNDKQPGTCISNSCFQKEQPSIKAILSKKNIFLISMESLNMWQEVGFLEKVFSCFRKWKVSVDLIATSQSNITISIDSSKGVLSSHLLDGLLSELEKICKAKLLGPFASLTLVGKNIRSILHKIGVHLEAFEEKKVHLVSQSASNLNFTFIIDEQDSFKILKVLHDKFFAQQTYVPGLGPSWLDLNNKKTNLSLSSWWKKEKKLLTNTTPSFVYDLDVVKKAIEKIKTLPVDKIHYATKANDNPDVLNYIAKQKIGFDCVSIEEVLYIKKFVAEENITSIGFTPNFVAIEEYKKAIELGCHVTVDNVLLLEEYPEVFKKVPIHLRLDSSSRAGHHKFVKTTGSQSKFGISQDDLLQIKKIADKYKIRITGLHVHVGSGIKDTSIWSEAASSLIIIAQKFFPEVKILNLGGGFAISESQQQKDFDIKSLSNNLLTIKKANPQYKLWIEPGRYLVAHAGILLAQITQIKYKQDKCYVGINTGMNSLLRPALYGSYHPVVNASAYYRKAKNSIIADIVGPICESADVFASSRSLVDPRVGDYVVIENTGAYGRVMSSYYNRKSPAKEIILNKTKENEDKILDY
jgi:bifunctional diaminopimelate decarboxylase / aspartate kinase